MKKLVLLSLFVSTFLFSQEDEIKNAVKAVESNNYNLTNTEIAKADAIIGENVFLLEPKLQSQYNYAKGLGLLNTGKTLEGSKYLSKVSDLETKPIWTAKNKTTKQTIYFTDKTFAEKYIAENTGFSTLKETKLSPTYVIKLGEILPPKVEKLYNEAQAEYQKKNYEISGNKFYETYNLMKAYGNNNQIIEYFAAISYHAAGKFDLAAPIYQDLITTDYTGEKITYTAVEKATNKAIQTENKSEFELLKKTDLYKDFKESKSENSQPEIYSSYINLLVDNDKSEEAIKLGEQGMKKYPSNELIVSSLGNAYYKAGKKDQFVALIKESINKNPKNEVNYYNLGVILGKDSSTREEAKQNYKKAIELNPKYIQAWNNYASVTLDQAKEAGDKEGEYLQSVKTRKLADEYNVKKKAYLKEAIPYLEKVRESDPKNLTILKSLKSTYGNLEMNDKFEQIAAEIKALSSK